MPAPKRALNYPLLAYAPANLIKERGITEEGQRVEYKRLRDIAQKRIQRLGASEFSTSAAYQENKAGFPSLTQLKQQAHAQAAAHGKGAEYERTAYQRLVRNNLSEVARFVNARSSTVSGAKEIAEETMETFREHFPEINWDSMNNEDFFAFLTWYHKRGGMKTFGISSEEVIQLYHLARRARLSTASLKKDLAYWHANAGLLEQRAAEIAAGRADGRWHSSNWMKQHMEG